MKKRIISIALILLLVFALTACGSVRSYEYDRNLEADELLPNDNTGTNDNAATRGTNDYTMRNRTIDDETQAMPDPADGYIREGSANDGIVEDQRPITSPKISKIH